MIIIIAILNDPETSSIGFTDNRMIITAMNVAMLEGINEDKSGFLIIKLSDSSSSLWIVIAIGAPTKYKVNKMDPEIFGSLCDYA